MPRTALDQALLVSLAWEGGLSDLPGDPGGRTYHGITQRVYDQFRASKGLAEQDVALMATLEERELYRVYFWQPIRGDEMPLPLAIAVFDFAINSGSQQAVRSLQRCLDVKDDGNVGPVTLSAANAGNCVGILDEYRAERLHYLEALRNWPLFGHGWERRVNGVIAHCKALCSM